MRKIYTVTEVNRYIKNKLSSDTFLAHIFIRGEISNYKKHSSGHIYFTIKDKDSVLSCVMFKGQAMGLRFEPNHGMNIIAGGYISVFERSGNYQLYVQDMQPDGLGALHLAYEQLKDKLEKEGLFDSEKKKRLPFLPEKICIITSPTGAAIRDMLNILKRRFPNIELIIIPVHVQGENAANEISEAIYTANNKIKPDIIITGRGGGSLEDLWAFNEEAVARAIAESTAPVISSVGHETDFTIADFVADLRAPTPSAAAELAVPEYSVIIDTINSYKERLKNGLVNQINRKRERLNGLAGRIESNKPMQKVNQYRQQTDLFMKYINDKMAQMLENKKERISFIIQKLNLLNPLITIERGYSAVKSADKRFIKSIEEVKENDNIEVIMKDGSLRCQVKEKVSEGDVIFGREKV
jgi:exodeoxyribonuclease VII large subunit